LLTIVTQRTAGQTKVRDRHLVDVYARVGQMDVLQDELVQIIDVQVVSVDGRRGQILLENWIEMLVQVVVETFLAENGMQHAYKSEQNGTVVGLHHQLVGDLLETERRPGQVRQADVHAVQVVHAVPETVGAEEHGVLHDHYVADRGHVPVQEHDRPE